MVDRRVMGQPGVGAAELRRYGGVRGGEALDVDLVHDRVGVGVAGRGWSLQSNAVSITRLRGTCPAESSALGDLRVVDGVAEHLRSEPYLAVDGPGVGVEQQLRRIAPQTPPRVVRSGGPVAVGLAGPYAGHEPVPDLTVALRQRDPGLGAVGVEQAQQHAVGRGGDGEVRAVRPGGRAERRRLPGSAVLDGLPLARAIGGPRRGTEPRRAGAG